MAISQALIPYSLSYVDRPFIKIPVVPNCGTFSLSLAIQRCKRTALVIVLPSLITRALIVSILTDNFAHSGIHLIFHLNSP